MNKRKVTRTIIISLLYCILILFLIELISAVPNGVTLDIKSSQNGAGNGSVSISAMAGNMTEIIIYGQSVVQSWQGYFGNITGGFALSDSNGSSIYNWSSINPNGEIYASVNQSIIWTNIQCFNYTATGTFDDDGSNKGNTSLYGLNLTGLETRYNISDSDTDGVNETFSQKNHEMFFTNNLLFETGECQNTKLLNSSGGGVFDEILLYSPDNKEVVFASIIEDDQDGFDNAKHDFEMIVLENGHNDNTEVTNYYFYIELG